MNKRELARGICFVAVFVALAPAGAQSKVTATASSLGKQSAEVTQPAPRNGPTTSAATVGVQRAVHGSLVVAERSQDDINVGRNVALMVVGGAGIVVGSIVGGDGGTLIMVSSGVIGLVGLFRYLQ